MLIISIPLWVIVQLTNRIKFHQAVYITMTLILLKLGYAEVKQASKECLKIHNAKSSNIEFMANCKREGITDVDSSDEYKHKCFMMRRYCALECSENGYDGGSCHVKALFTLNLNLDSQGNYKTLDCVCIYNTPKIGCYSTYHIPWETVTNEFENKCAMITTTTKSTTKPTTTMKTTTTTTTTTTVTPKIVLIGGEKEPAKSTIEIFYLDKSKENEIITDALLHPRHSHVSFSLKNGTILTCGGQNSVTLSDCESFDPITKKSSIAGKLIIPRRAADVAFLDGIPYICGGRNNYIGFMSSCEYYSSGLWKDGPEMKNKRTSPVVTSHNDYLYVIGGYSDEYFESVARYSKAKNEWSFVDFLKSKRSSPAAASFQELSYVCGGLVSNRITDTCEIFDPKHGKWYSGSQMNHARYKFNLVTAGGYLYAVGGRTLVVERYDVKKKKWIDLKVKTKYERFKSYAVGMP